MPVTLPIGIIINAANAVVDRICYGNGMSRA